MKLEAVAQATILTKQWNHLYNCMVVKFSDQPEQGKTDIHFVNSILLRPAAIMYGRPSSILEPDIEIFRPSSILITLCPETTDLARDKLKEVFQAKRIGETHQVFGLSNRFITLPREGVLTHGFVQNVLSTLYCGAYLSKEELSKASESFGVVLPCVEKTKIAKLPRSFYDPQRPQNERKRREQKKNFLLYFLSNRALAQP